jgi:hypothetical protein
MRIVYTERDIFGLELCGTFLIEIATADAFTSRRFAEHGVAADRQLLKWIRHLPESANDVEIPKDSLESDRIVYVIADLIEQKGEIITRCRQCNALVPLETITVEQKDFSTDSSGIHMGFAGDLYLCAQLHGLLFSVTKIF